MIWLVKWQGEKLPDLKPIFVYGTLMVGCRNYNRSLYRYSELVEEATTCGMLFHLDEKNYPAMILEGEDLVLGEVHWVSDYERCIDELDAIENYEDDRNPQYNEYNRTDITVSIGGEEMTMPSYIYNRKGVYNYGDKLIAIADGNWKKFLADNNLSCRSKYQSTI